MPKVQNLEGGVKSYHLDNEGPKLRDGGKLLPIRESFIVQWGMMKISWEHFAVFWICGRSNKLLLILCAGL